MKKSTLLLFFLAAFFAPRLFAQTPQAIHYQAIARFPDGKPMPNEGISIEFSILNGSISGAAVYREKHQTQTNSFGLFFAEIGRGQVLDGNFLTIDWANGLKFLKVEINNTLQDTTQLLSVPYALYAADAPEKQQLAFNPQTRELSLSPGNMVVVPPGLTEVATTAPLTGNGTSGSPVALQPGTLNNQVLAWDNSAMTWNPRAVDLSATNEIQDLELAGNQLSLSQSTGNAVLLPQQLDDLTDVAAATPAIGDILEWSGSAWVAGGGIPAGTILPFAGDILPSGYLWCDGSGIDRTNPTYQALFDAIGFNWGRVNNQIFNLPDLRGRFLRGQDEGTGRDPDASSRPTSNAGGNAGDNVGSLQADDFKSHNHGLNNAFDVLSRASTTLTTQGGGNFGYASITVQNNGGSETRPKNANVRFIIKL